MPANDTDRSEQKIEASQIDLPKGGGAIQGMGEKYQTNEFSGSATLSIPVQASACRGSEPQLSIDYSSGNGNSPFGLGFDLAIDNISRKTSKGVPKYVENDVYLLSGAEDLVLESDPVQIDDYRVISYRPRIEGLFAKIEQWIASDKSSYWKVRTKDNHVNVFGTKPETRIADPDNPTHIYQWLLEESYDDKGNHVYYQYKQENSDHVDLEAVYEKNRNQTANRYIEKIKYGSFKVGEQVHYHFEVVFDYGEYDISPDKPDPYQPKQPWLCRDDSFSSYNSGFEIRTHRLCRNVLMFHYFPDETTLGNNRVLVSATTLEYDEKPTISLLTSVQHSGYSFDKEQGYKKKEMPAMDLAYQEFKPLDSNRKFQPLEKENKTMLPDLNKSPEYMLVDLFGEGLPGVLYSDGKSSTYFNPKGYGQYSKANELKTFPIDRNVQAVNNKLVDITGNGALDLVTSTVFENGYYEAKVNQEWEPYERFSAFPSDFNNPDNTLVDLSGDGLSDCVLVEHDKLTIFESLGKAGFAKPLVKEKKTSIPFLCQTEVEIIQFTDILGAGSQQLVKIADGMVECWPSLGYGSFGEKIQLGNAPRFGKNLETSRIFLADLDGSGPQDLVFVYHDHAEIFINNSGNYFEKEPITLDFAIEGSEQTLSYDRINKIDFSDVLGKGSTAMVINQTHPKPKQWYYDFCSIGKPYLLNRADNNMGATTTIEYASSVEFYLKDKTSGLPWITQLPFPVQVVKKTDTIDALSYSRLTACYDYHHGYYDGGEREFRGFGMVERQDDETFESFDRYLKTLPNTIDSQSMREGYTAPRKTKTWYHTGAYLEAASLSRQYEKEYYQKDRSAWQLPDSVYDESGFVGEDLREAYRALKGSVLREEVYGLDGNEHPYTVSEHNYLVKLLQPKGQNKHGVYLKKDRQILDYSYERNPKDPRISHELTLKTDEYGNVLRSCSIAYPRRDSIKANDCIDEQTTIKITCEEITVINDVTGNSRYIGVDYQDKNYEIKNPAWIHQKTLLTFKETDDYIETVLNEPDPATANLLSWERHYYCEKNTKLALGKIAVPLLLYNVEHTEFEADKLIEELKDVLTEEELNTKLTEGQFVRYSEKQEPDREARKYWWNPGMHQQYFDEKTFYLLQSTGDPWNRATTYAYDNYQLMMKSVVNAIGKRVKFEKFDFEHLQPMQMIDVNNNTSEVLLDPLGMVIATSHYGNETRSGKTKRVGFEELKLYTIQPVDHWQQVVEKPFDYLQKAASYFFYDFQLKDGKFDQKPALAIEVKAEYYPDTTAYKKAVEENNVPVAMVYSDGFGRELQSKMKVEPGMGHYIDDKGFIQEKPSSNRWLTSGLKVYNNKGNPVREYEPYYFIGPDYVDNPDINKFGVTTVTTYDPLDRVVRVDLPKGQWNDKGLYTKVEFTPWHELHYDANDTIKDSIYYEHYIEKDPALKKAEVFYKTPTENIVDNLGRTIDVIEQLTSEQMNEDKEFLRSHSEYDIAGNVISSADARLYPKGLKNTVSDYSLTGGVVKAWSCDSGTRWHLTNCLGNPIFGYDSRKFATSIEYDLLHRPKSIKVQGGDHETKLDQIVEQTIYGDESDIGVDNPTDHNLIGQPYKVFDSPGLDCFEEYNILGEYTSVTRRFNKEYKKEVNWSDISDPDTLLQLEKYNVQRYYDAVGRVVEEIDSSNNIQEPRYFISNRLAGVDVTCANESKTPYVVNIDYNAKGQRNSVEYGNNISTYYEYDPYTFALNRIHSKRENDEKLLQDLNYRYDPVGNITHLTDNAFETVFHDQQEVSPESDYAYDSLYHLIRANGRQHPGTSQYDFQQGAMSDKWFIPMPKINDDNKLQNYTRLYNYDHGNNMTGIQHSGRASQTSWTRDMEPADDSNRLKEGNYDANGNSLGASTAKPIVWNYRNNIEKVDIVTREEYPNDSEYYVYDQNGRRLRKITEQYGNEGKTVKKIETIYWGPLEIKRTTSNETIDEETERLRVMDDERCIAEHLVWTVGAPPEGVANPQVRYQLENNIGSSTMEINENSEIISYEEYFPYGGTSFVSGKNYNEVNLRQYRYSGKERDASTGFYYYGLRYFESWSCRWLSPDPAGVIDGLNLYAFVGGNPINKHDEEGLCGTRKRKKRKTGEQHVGRKRSRDHRMVLDGDDGDEEDEEPDDFLNILDPDEERGPKKKRRKKSLGDQDFDYVDDPSTAEYELFIPKRRRLRREFGNSTKLGNARWELHKQRRRRRGRKHVSRRTFGRNREAQHLIPANVVNDPFANSLSSQISGYPQLFSGFDPDPLKPILDSSRNGMMLRAYPGKGSPYKRGRRKKPYHQRFSQGCHPQYSKNVRKLINHVRPTTTTGFERIMDTLRHATKISSKRFVNQISYNAMLKSLALF